VANDGQRGVAVVEGTRVATEAAVHEGETVAVVTIRTAAMSATSCTRGSSGVRKRDGGGEGEIPGWGEHF